MHCGITAFDYVTFELFVDHAHAYKCVLSGTTPPPPFKYPGYAPAQGDKGDPLTPVILYMYQCIVYVFVLTENPPGDYEIHLVTCLHAL